MNSILTAYLVIVLRGNIYRNPPSDINQRHNPIY